MEKIYNNHRFFLQNLLTNAKTYVIMRLKGGVKMKEDNRRILRVVCCIIILIFSTAQIINTVSWGFFGVETGDKFVGNINLVYVLLPTYLLLAATSVLRLVWLGKEWSSKQELPIYKTAVWAKIAYAVCALTFMIYLLSWLFYIPFITPYQMPLGYFSVFAFTVVFFLAERRRRRAWFKEVLRKRLTFVSLGVGIASLCAVCFTGYQIWAHTRQINQGIPFVFQTSPQYFCTYLIGSVALVLSVVVFSFCFTKNGQKTL